MISTTLIILPMLAVLFATFPTLVPVSIVWSFVSFFKGIQQNNKLEATPENQWLCKSFSYLPLQLAPHSRAH